ncbi:unnamed protein product [Soboliphyme baturini]|uniref:Uncharacterized protein n=1 Tax=Soboliphyme baturini TaxID=241478 RepID=A0A183IMB1_9BILA|nr:unnamed protein product [Soboliphyme baturini]
MPGKHQMQLWSLEIQTMSSVINTRDGMLTPATDPDRLRSGERLVACSGNKLCRGNVVSQRSVVKTKLALKRETHPLLEPSPPLPPSRPVTNLAQTVAAAPLPGPHVEHGADRGQTMVGEQRSIRHSGRRRRPFVLKACTDGGRRRVDQPAYLFTLSSKSVGAVLTIAA